jgi:hypothetical protein
MKLVIFLLLGLVPYTPEAFSSVDERFPGNRTLDKYTVMEQDATRVEQGFQKRFFMPERNSWTTYVVTGSGSPVIRQDTWTPRDDRKFPIGNDMKRERTYAVLPGSISFQDVRKRLLETLLIRRNGRKYEDMSDGYP